MSITNKKTNVLDTNISIQKLKEMGNSLSENPLKSKHTADEVREINRIQ